MLTFANDIIVENSFILQFKTFLFYAFTVDERGKFSEIKYC